MAKMAFSARHCLVRRSFCCRNGLCSRARCLLAYKPQLSVVIPFALLAAGQWRTIVAAAVTVIALAGASFVLFGADAWWSFLASTETSRRLLLEQGNVGFEKLQSVFAAVRMWGGSVALAYMVQAVVSAAAVCGTAWVWHSSRHRNVKAALLLAATALASPHILNYDLMLLAPSMAFFVAARSDRRFWDYEISGLAAVWIAPLLARSAAGLTGVPIGFLASLTLFVLIMRRALRERDESAVGACGIAQA
jgi:Glycosyltransferase family 87